MNGDARQFVARMRSTLILLAAALLPPASADAMDRPFRVPAATFQEIFGLYEFPRAAGLALILVVTSLLAVAPIQVLDGWARRKVSGQ